jgi:hypothetical protein
MYHAQIKLIDKRLAEANSALNEALRAGNPRYTLSLGTHLRLITSWAGP